MNFSTKPDYGVLRNYDAELRWEDGARKKKKLKREPGGKESSTSK